MAPLSQAAAHWVCNRLPLSDSKVEQVHVHGLEELTSSETFVASSSRKSKWVDVLETHLRNQSVVRALTLRGTRTLSASSSNPGTRTHQSNSNANFNAQNYLNAMRVAPRSTSTQLPQTPATATATETRQSILQAQAQLIQQRAQILQQRSQMLRQQAIRNQIPQRTYHNYTSSTNNNNSAATQQRHPQRQQLPAYTSQPTKAQTQSFRQDASHVAQHRMGHGKNRASRPAAASHPTPFAATTTTTTTAAATAPSTSRVKVKKEKGVIHTPYNTATTNTTADTGRSSTDTEITASPLTPREYQLMASLAQMGFTNPNEIRQAILATRPLQDEDSCMMWIIRQREEQEEALKMDAARAESLRLRDAARSTRKMDAAQQAYDSATTLQDLKTIFSKSVLLTHHNSNNEDDNDDCNSNINSDCIQHLKQNTETSKPLYDLLKLEQKMLQWYRDIPWCYLVHLATMWKKKKPTATEIKSTIQQLEIGMYSLGAQHQRGGIPLLFLKAQEDAQQKGKPINPCKMKKKNLTKRTFDNANDCEMIDDNEVMVVEVKKSKLDTCTTKPPEVIEIV